MSKDTDQLVNDAYDRGFIEGVCWQRERDIRACDRGKWENLALIIAAVLMVSGAVYHFSQFPAL